MPDKSINASNGQEKGIIGGLNCGITHSCLLFTLGCREYGCSLLNNRFEDGINPQESLETQELTVDRLRDIKKHLDFVSPGERME